jgi:putative nucleotidyltransferase with HDIG domain
MADDALSTRLTVQPLTAKAVVNSVRRPSDLAPVVRIDPALAATVLRLANSAHYGWSGRVTNASQACLLLGSRTVQAISANGTASLLFGTGRESTRAGFWAHSLHTATACAGLARAVGLTPEDAFTLGLLHDIGHLLTDRSDLSEAEIAELGAQLLQAWSLPEHLVRALRVHASRAGASASTSVAGKLARVLTAGHSIAHGLDVRDVAVEMPSVGDALRLAGLPTSAGRLVLQSIDRELAGVTSVLTELAS